MNPRVFLVVSTIDGAGPGRVMAGLGRELPALGYEPLVVATHGPEHTDFRAEVESWGVEVAHLGMRGMLDRSGPRRFVGLVKQRRPAVVHTRQIRSDLIGRLAHRRGAAVINNIVNLYPDDSLALHGPVKGRAIVALGRATRRAVDLWVANARALRPCIRSVFHVPDDRIRLVYDGLDLAPWIEATPADLTALGIGPDDPVCLTVGRLHHQKGLGDLLDAAAILVPEHPDLRVVVVGDGPLRSDLAAGIEAAGLNRNVILAGYRGDVPAMMARTRLFVLASRFEGLPSVVIEAMAAGVPVVATAVGGVPELIEDGAVGRLVAPGAPAALAAAIGAELDSEPGTRAGPARARALDLFSVGAMARAFAGVYEEVLSTALGDDRRAGA